MITKHIIVSIHFLFTLNSEKKSYFRTLNLVFSLIFTRSVLSFSDGTLKCLQRDTKFVWYEVGGKKHKHNCFTVILSLGDNRTKVVVNVSLFLSLMMKARLFYCWKQGFFTAKIGPTSACVKQIQTKYGPDGGLQRSGLWENDVVLEGKMT